MKELMILMASAMPKELLIEKLKESINEWENDPSEENWKSIENTSVLITIKKHTGHGDIQKANEIIEEMDKAEKAMDIITPKDN